MTITARGRRVIRWSVAVAALLAAVPPAGAQEKNAQAGQETRMQIEETETIASVLKRFEGKPVRLRLAGSGEELSGKVAKVTPDVVHLSELAGREFFDAVIRIDQVAAVVVQTRGR